MEKTIIVLVACLTFCSCYKQIDHPKNSKSLQITAEVLSIAETHDNFGDLPHEINVEVEYEIITPTNLSGHKFTMFYPLSDATNKETSVNTIVEMEINKVLLDIQANK